MAQYLTNQYSESNVHPIGLDGSIYPPNEVAVARNITKYQPRSINNNNTASVTVCNLSGQIEFNFNTSNMQWLDLYDSYFLTRYTTVVGAGPSWGKILHLTQNTIGQAYLYVNGVQVAYTNNWTVASKINKRLQFSKQYNESMHDINYRSDVSLVAAGLFEIAAAAGGDGPIGAGYQISQPVPYIQPDTAGVFTDKENLDGFFMRDKHSCWIPPNCEVRIVLIVDPNAFRKATRVAAATPTSTCIINSIEFVATSLIRNIPGPVGEWILKFVTNQITTSTVTADCNRNLTVSPNIMKTAIVFQAPMGPGAAGDILDLTQAGKTAAGDVLAYVTQNEKTDTTRAITGAAGAAQLNTLQLQLGSIVNPPQAYDFATNLHREAYEQYLQLSGKSKSNESQESFFDWLTEPIYLFDFPRPDEDKSTNLIVRATRTLGAVTPQMHIVEMDLTVVSMKFDPTSGAVIETLVN